MHRMRSGPAPAGTDASPVEQPSRISENHQTYAHRSTETAKRNAAGSRHTAPSFPVSTSNAAAWALFTLVVGTILIVACVLLTLGWPR